MFIYSRSIVLTLVSAFVISISGCASNKAPVEPKMVKSITVVPANAPDKLATENKGPPLVGALWTGIANTILDKGKSAEFEAKYAAYRLTMGTKLTTAVVHELQAKGFKVQIANSIDVVRDKDGELNFKKFSEHDTVLEIYYSEVGMYSGRATPHYMPMVNIYAALVQPPKNTYLMDNTYYYGAYASKDEGSYLLSETKYQFPGFSDLMTQPELVMQAYDAGIQKTAIRIANDYRKAFAPAQ